MKDIVFLDLNDGSTGRFLQIAVDKSKHKTSDLTYGSSITVKGELSVSPNGKMELRADDINIIGKCVVTDGYPFSPRKVYSSEYVREFLHFRPQTRTFASTLRLRDIATSVVSDHLRNKGYINIHTPIITSNDCEGAGEIFVIKPDSQDILDSMKREGVNEDCSYFNTKAFLTVSGQFHLEAAAR